MFVFLDWRDLSQTGVDKPKAKRNIIKAEIKSNVSILCAVKKRSKLWIHLHRSQLDLVYVDNCNTLASFTITMILTTWTQYLAVFGTCITWQSHSFSLWILIIWSCWSRLLTVNKILYKIISIAKLDSSYKIIIYLIKIVMNLPHWYACNTSWMSESSIFHHLPCQRKQFNTSC